MNRILRRSIRCGAMVLWLSFSVVMASAADGKAPAGRKATAAQKAAEAKMLDDVWPYLDSSEAVVRQSARVVIQTVPFAQWKDRALEEKSTWASLELLRALAESCPRQEAAAFSPHLCEQITTLRLEQMEPAQLIAAIRATRLVFEKLGPLSGDELSQMRDLWGHLAVSKDSAAAREQRELVEFLGKVQPRSPEKDGKDEKD